VDEKTYRVSKFTMTEQTSEQRICYTLWEHESTQHEMSHMLLPGCPFNSIDIYGDREENTEAGHHIIKFAETALRKPKPDIQDFIELFRIKPEEIYDLDDDFLKRVSDKDDVDTLENRVHNVLKSNSKDYGIFRQFAINAASTHPASFGAFGESVKTAHDAAIFMLGSLYLKPPSASLRLR
jgi:hypothetical protein